MLYKDYFGSIVASIVMLVLGAAMAFVSMLWLGMPLTFPAFFTTAGSAFLINYLAALVFPASEWANKLCMACKTKPGSLPFLLLNNLVTTAVYVVIVTAGMTLLNTGFTPVFFPAWMHVLPILFVAGYIVAFIMTLIALKIATGIVSKQAK